LYKNSLRLFSLILILSLLLSACGGNQPGINTAPTITAAPPRGTTGTISTSNTIAAASGTVPSSGGTMEVSESGTPITGLELNVPANAYASTKTFEISYAPIEKHSFGEAFNPITPLISIKNGGEYADELMEVKIPVKVATDSFAMGFIYDAKTRTLEGLPTLAQDADSITVGTRHFSDIIISEISNALLKKDIESGFRPGIDDWQFTNRGSYVAGGGHCAGQSMSAMWYYIIQPDGKDLTLNGRYDNNGDKPATPAFWQDDSLGYRLASTTQVDMDWENWGRKISLNYLSESDETTYKLFAYSIQVTGEPQMVEIWNNTVGGGHAMVVYRVVDGSLYIADPNYPNNTERRIEYSGSKFKPYESGANKEEIDKGNSKSYDQIVYIAKSSIIDWNKAAVAWQDFKAGTIGKDRFPDYEIVWTDDKNQNHPLVDGYVSPSKLININANSKSPALPNTDISIRTYRAGAELKWDANGNYELIPGENKLGIYIVGQVDATDKNGNPIKVEKFIDFKYLSITFTSDDSKISIDPPTLDGQEKQVYTFNLVNPGKIDYVRLDWLIDDIIAEPASRPSFQAGFPAGDHTVTVNLYDLSHKLLGTADSTIHIDALIVSNLPKLQQMRSISGAFFGKNTYSLSTGGEMVNGSSIGAPSIPITWSGTSFSGKLTVEDNNSPSTDEIQGSVSNDGKTLQSLTFTHSDYNYGGYGKSNPNYTMYTKSMQLQNVPLSQYEIGKGLVSGPATQACVVKLEYKETSFKNGVKSYEKTYVSTDWAASGIGATPQIGIYFGK